MSSLIIFFYFHDFFNFQFAFLEFHREEVDNNLQIECEADGAISNKKDHEVVINSSR